MFSFVFTSVYIYIYDEHFMEFNTSCTKQKLNEK